VHLSLTAAAVRIWIEQAAQAAAIERPPFTFRQGKPVGHGTAAKRGKIC